MTTTSIAVLGGGMMGHALALDLAADDDLEVTVIDAREEALERLAARGVQTLARDLSEPAAVRDAVADHDLVCGALSSRLGFQTLRAVIEAGKPCADLAFMAEDALELDGLARERGVCALVDCGVAPGISNLLVGDALRRFERVDRLAIFVGGLPVERRWPWAYKAPFDPADVLEEYTRPSRLVVGGRVVVRPALSEPERLHVDGLGALEAFNTDGLRSLLRLPIPEMIEKTLRYPGHRALMEILRESGFFSDTPVELADGTHVRPRDLTARLLFPMWTFEEGEADWTVLRVQVEGALEGRARRATWTLLDRRDDEAGLSSMARTTAFPCAIIARLLARGAFTTPGVHAPETLGRGGLWPEIRAALARRQITLQEEIDDV